jgi:F-type H+-transporting ATPase subunit delta
VAATGSGLSGLASRYATALYALADEGKALDRTAEDLRGIRSLIGESDDLRRLVRSPLLSRGRQAAAMAAILARAGVSDLVARFVGLVARNRRLFALQAMIDAFLAELARRRGEITARVTTAVPLAGSQAGALENQLKKTLGAKVQLDIETDPALLGGMIVRVGSRMVDSSLRTKLAKLQFAMKGTA